MKINFKIKSLIFLISFLSLFTYDIVNSEEIKDYPYKKGSYLVCANGKAIPIKFWNNLFLEYDTFNALNPQFWNGDWRGQSFLNWTTSLSRRFNTTAYLSFVPKKGGSVVYTDQVYEFWITAEVIVGKEPKRYLKDEREVIIKKLMKGGRIPTSYKSTSIGLEPNQYGDVYPGQWLYKFKNSENKEISIGFYPYFSGLTDNNGNTFRGSIDDDDLLMFYCTNDYIVLRAVEEIYFYEGQVTNEFNENVELPTIFMTTEVGVKAQSPNMKKNYEF